MIYIYIYIYICFIVPNITFNLLVKSYYITKTDLLFVILNLFVGSFFPGTQADQINQYLSDITEGNFDLSIYQV